MSDELRGAAERVLAQSRVPDIDQQMSHTGDLLIPIGSWNAACDLARAYLAEHPESPLKFRTVSEPGATIHVQTADISGIIGKWPGDETEEEITAILEELS